MNFSAMPTDIVFLNNCYVFTTERWDLFAIVQSTLHEVWARKYSMSFELRLQYSPSNCFTNFPFPTGLWKNKDPELAALGEQYHEHRGALMQSLWMGLTTVYNLFHNPELSPDIVATEANTGADVGTVGFEAILELRRLHVVLDLAIRDAYGWQDLDLEYDFHEVETLPENDRVRYTISSDARREVLQRLLAENHARAEAEAASLVAKGKRGTRTGDGATDGVGFL